MAESLTCPNCSTEMQHDDDFSDVACSECGLSGPREVIERAASWRVAARTCSAALAQANDVDHILDEAGRLLMEAGATTGDKGAFALRREKDFRRFEGKTLSEAYRKMVGGGNG